MAMSIAMHNWLGETETAVKLAAQEVWNGRGDALVVLPFGTEAPGVQHDDDVTALTAIDLLRAVVAEYERDHASDEDYEPVDIILPPKEIR